LCEFGGKDEESEESTAGAEERRRERQAVDFTALISSNF